MELFGRSVDLSEDEVQRLVNEGMLAQHPRGLTDAELSALHEAVHYPGPTEADRQLREREIADNNAAPDDGLARPFVVTSTKVHDARCAHLKAAVWAAPLLPAEAERLVQYEGYPTCRVCCPDITVPEKSGRQRYREAVQALGWRPHYVGWPA